MACSNAMMKRAIYKAEDFLQEARESVRDGSMAYARRATGRGLRILGAVGHCVDQSIVSDRVQSDFHDVHRSLIRMKSRIEGGLSGLRRPRRRSRGKRR